MKKAVEIVKKLTLAEKLRMLTSHFTESDRLGLKSFNVGTEVARGYVSHGEGGKQVDISTVLPQPVGLASTFDKDVMYKLGKIAAEELRYYWKAEKQSKLMLFGPTVDLLRDPRWGRNEEAYGEDPFLSGSQALAYCTGLTEPDTENGYMKTAPGLKHFCANNHEESRASDNADITMKLLHEYYYAPFRRIISAGKAAGVMASYNELGGVPAVMNPDLLNEVKGKWGADYVVSDGGDFSQNYLNHKQFSSHAEAFAYTIKNGTDCVLDNPDMVETAAREALRTGLITEADIDRAVLNTLTVREKLGEFDPECEYNHKEFSADTKEFQAVNKRAAYEQVCLLKNDGILPLSKNKKVALIGPIADENYNDWYTGTASYYVSIKDAFEDGFGKFSFDNGYDHVNISGTDGLFEHHDWGESNSSSVMTFRDVTSRLWLSEDEHGVYNETAEKVYDWFTWQWFKPSYDASTDTYTFKNVFDKPLGIKDGKIAVADNPHGDRFKLNVVSDGCERAAKVAGEADQTVVVVGNQPMLVARECYDRKSLKLPPQQEMLIRAVAAANPNTVLVIVSSYPYILGDIEGLVKAVVYTTHAGAELGNAVKDVITGAYNPAARCPQTWYKYDSDLPSIKDYRIDKNHVTYQYFDSALYPFGHGLSYSEFKFENFEVKLQGDFINASFDITNVSDVDGDEVYQIYVSRQNRDKLLSLCAYGRVHIAAGEKTCLSVKIPLSDLAEYNTEMGEMMPLILSPTEVLTLSLGSSSRDIKATQMLSISEADGFTLLARDLTKRTLAKSYDTEENTTLGFDYKKNDWYVKTGDWGGKITFINTDLTGATAVEIAAAAPNAEATLTILADGETVGECVVKPSVSHTDYAYYSVPLTGAKGSSLTVSVKGLANIWSIQILRNEE
ncbi:MAG: glycoside hydrolase family 3 C-terminal domain-containing protein [Ruminococcus sp.]|jgi:beta-glucosidase|nr:glycoside hydrolase family 3 C-terminal domain-containing protein [Ruminococcus sp.]